MGKEYYDDFLDDDYEDYDDNLENNDDDDYDDNLENNDDDEDYDDLGDFESQKSQASNQNLYSELDEEIKNLFIGQTNPFTGKAVENLSDLKELNKMKRSAERKAMLEGAGLDEDTLNSIFEESPYIKEIKGFLEEKRAREASEAIEREISKISEINPDIKKFEDLFMSENFPKMNELIMKGYAISDAYILCNIEALNKKAGEKEKNNVISKIRRNKEASPGSLSGGNSESEKSIDEMTDEEFEKMLAKAKRGELMRK